MMDKDSLLKELDLSCAYQPVLQILRLYLQSVAEPGSLAWMAALAGAEEAYDRTYGPQIAVRVLTVMQRVRVSRRSVFDFNSPVCPTCSQIVSEHERRFMIALDCAGDGRLGQAQMELIMLCEGNDVDEALSAMDDLNRVIAEFELSKTDE